MKHSYEESLGLEVGHKTILRWSKRVCKVKVVEGMDDM